MLAVLQITVLVALGVSVVLGLAGAYASSDGNHAVNMLCAFSICAAAVWALPRPAVHQLAGVPNPDAWWPLTPAVLGAPLGGLAALAWVGGSVGLTAAAMPVYGLVHARRTGAGVPAELRARWEHALERYDAIRAAYGDSAAEALHDVDDERTAAFLDALDTAERLHHDECPDTEDDIAAFDAAVHQLARTWRAATARHGDRQHR